MIVSVLSGDIGFVSGQSGFSAGIKVATFGKEYDFQATHVFGVARQLDGQISIYETEAGMNKGKGRSSYQPIDKYSGQKVKIFRPLYLSDESLREYYDSVCAMRVGTPYSGWDCALNGVLGWLHPAVKRKVISRLGSEAFTKCDEEILLTHEKVHKLRGLTIPEWLKYPEGQNPQELYNAVKYHTQFLLVYDSTKAA